MIDNCNINNLAKNQVSAIFLSRAIRRSVLPKFITSLAPRAGRMTQIARCGWLPERARWSHLARSGLPALSRKKNFTESHIINPLLTKFVRSRWLDIGLVLFINLDYVSVHNHTKKRTWQISSHLDLTLGQ